VPDLRFDVEQAVALLHSQAARAVEFLQERAADLEAELRAVAAAIASRPTWDIEHAVAIHVMEINTGGDSHGYGRLAPPAGAEIELLIYGSRLAASRTSRPLEPGRYRAVLQLTKLPDVEPPR
jgi:hypothetical protein